MIVGYHVIFSAYGFWLPNDPRGSWSNFVGSWELYRYGPATRTADRCSVAHVEHDQTLRHAAKAALKYPPVQFTGLQARAIARGFARHVGRSHLTIYACAILPDHIHLVVKPTSTPVERVVIGLKAAATQQLEREAIHPLSAWRRNGRLPKCFTRGHWKTYLDAEDLSPAIHYVTQNPTKEGKPLQHWNFVTEG